MKLANIVNMKPSKNGLTIKSEFSTAFVQRVIKELEAVIVENDPRTEAIEALLIELRETILNM